MVWPTSCSPGRNLCTISEAENLHFLATTMFLIAQGGAFPEVTDVLSEMLLCLDRLATIINPQCCVLLARTTVH